LGDFKLHGPRADLANQPGDPALIKQHTLSHLQIYKRLGHGAVDRPPDPQHFLVCSAGGQPQPVAAPQQHVPFLVWKIANNDPAGTSFLDELQSRGEMAALIAAEQETQLEAIHHGEFPPAA
jgi:hypothetical protein